MIELKENPLVLPKTTSCSLGMLDIFSKNIFCILLPFSQWFFQHFDVKSCGSFRYTRSVFLISSLISDNDVLLVFIVVTILV